MTEYSPLIRASFLINCPFILTYVVFKKSINIRITMSNSWLKTVFKVEVITHMFRFRFLRNFQQWFILTLGKTALWYMKQHISGFLIHFHLILWELYGGARHVELVMCGHLWNYDWLHYLHSHLRKLIGTGLDRNCTGNPLTLVLILSTSSAFAKKLYQIKSVTTMFPTKRTF